MQLKNIWKNIVSNLNPELRDPVNAIGTALCIIGAVLMFSLLVTDRTPEPIPVIGFVLWAVGIGILFRHGKK